MAKNSFVLAGLLLVFLKSVSGTNCTAILNTCKTILRPVSDSLIAGSLSANRSECEIIIHEENECNLRQNFQDCLNTAFSCYNDVEISSELKRNEEDNKKCWQGRRCDTKVKQCRCITDTEKVKPPTSQYITKICKNIDSLRDCVSLIKQCGHSTEMQEAIAFIYFFTYVCKFECPGMILCFNDFVDLPSSSSGSSDFSADYEKLCGVTTFFQCLSENTKACSSRLSNKWQKVDRSTEVFCSAPVKMWDDFSNCSSLLTCYNNVALTKNIRAKDVEEDESVTLANFAALMDALVNPGWWCSYLTHVVGCLILEADNCSLDATERQEAVTLKATLDGLCEDTDVRQNCTLLLHACNSSLKPDAQFGVRTRQSIQLVQCHVIQSVETTCSSFEKLQFCVNNTLLPNYCEDDPVISSQISNLRQSYSDPCSKDTMCAIELVKCACTADILNSARMCKSIDIYKNCAGKIKDCDKSTQVWQSLSITFKMSEGACKTECPSAFTCWMYAEDQVDFLFARLHSAVEIFKSQICRSLATQFQCLLKNTSSCSSSLSLQWQRVEKSYEAVCSIFQPNTTNTSSCASLRTCVYKAQLVSEVSLDDLKSMGVVLIHAADVGEAILDPRTWCRVLIHTMECMEQEADNCLLTTAMKAKVAAANATVRGLCKADEDNTQDSNKQSDTAVIAGAAVAGAAVVGLSASSSLLFWKKRKRQRLLAEQEKHRHEEGSFRPLHDPDDEETYVEIPDVGDQPAPGDEYGYSEIQDGTDKGRRHQPPLPKRDGQRTENGENPYDQANSSSEDVRPGPSKKATKKVSVNLNGAEIPYDVCRDTEQRRSSSETSSQESPASSSPSSKGNESESYTYPGSQHGQKEDYLTPAPSSPGAQKTGSRSLAAAVVKGADYLTPTSAERQGQTQVVTAEVNRADDYLTPTSDTTVEGVKVATDDVGRADDYLTPTSNTSVEGKQAATAADYYLTPTSGETRDTAEVAPANDYLTPAPGKSEKGSTPGVPDDKQAHIYTPLLQQPKNPQFVLSEEMKKAGYLTPVHIPTTPDTQETDSTISDRKKAGYLTPVEVPGSPELGTKGQEKPAPSQDVKKPQDYLTPVSSSSPSSSSVAAPAKKKKEKSSMIPLAEFWSSKRLSSQRKSPPSSEGETEATHTYEKMGNVKYTEPGNDPAYTKIGEVPVTVSTDPDPSSYQNC